MTPSVCDVSLLETSDAADARASFGFVVTGEKKGRTRITSDVRALKKQRFPGIINIKRIGHLAVAAFGSR